MEILQIILISSLIVLSLTFIGALIYLIIVLKDFRESVDEARTILRTIRKVSSSAIFPLTSVMGIVGGISKGLKAIKSISSVFEEDEEDEEYEDD